MADKPTEIGLEGQTRADHLDEPSAPIAGPADVELSVCGPDLTQLFRKKGPLTLGRLRKLARETPVKDLTLPELDALATEVIGNKQLPKLSTLLLELADEQRQVAIASQLGTLAALVVAQSTAPPAEDTAAHTPILRGANDVLQFISAAVAERKGKEKHDLSVLILLVSLDRALIRNEDIPSLMVSLFSTKKGKRRPAASSEAEIGDTLLRHVVRPTELKVALEVKAAHELLVEDLLAQQASLRTSREELRQQLSDRDTIEHERQALVSGLEAELAALRERLVGLKQDLVSYRTSSTYTLQSTKARVLGTLSGELTRWLETARDASAADPPRTNVINERLNQAMQKIEAEVMWLQSLG
jgi:hypothetical protein